MADNQETTKKARFINNLYALSEGEKVKSISFFSKYPCYEAYIDWNNKNLQYKDFEKVFEVASKSSNALKRMEKQNPILALKRHNCKIIDQNEQYIIAIPLDWECAIFFNSFACGGEGAKWCIGDKKNPNSWNRYRVDENVFFLVYFMNRHFRFGKKVLFQYDTNEYDCAIWHQDDRKSLKMEDWYFDIIYNIQKWNTGTDSLPKDFKLLTSLFRTIKEAALSIDIEEILFVKKPVQEPEEPEDTVISFFDEIETFKLHAMFGFFDEDEFDTIIEKVAKIYDMGNATDRKRIFYEIEILEIEKKIDVLRREASQNSEVGVLIQDGIEKCARMDAKDSVALAP
jgi:hypothetical protein